MSSEMVKTSLTYLLVAYGSWRLFWDVVKYVRRTSDRSAAETKELQLLNQRKPPELWNRVFFFPDYIPDEPGSVTSQIIKLLEASRICIQLCLYLSSFRPFETAVLRKFREGLIVQVITDADTIKDHSTIGRWKKLGIPIRVKSTGYLMHNKFVIIDDEAVLTGSLNWTNQGVTGNRENLLVTTDTRLVGAYRQEYRNMWTEFSDVDMDA